MDKFSITAILIVVTAFIFVLSEPATNYYQNCYESIVEANELKNKYIITGNKPLICGIRERNAMPNVYQCYAMKYGCSK